MLRIRPGFGASSPPAHILALDLQQTPRGETLAPEGLGASLEGEALALLYLQHLEVISEHLLRGERLALAYLEHIREGEALALPLSEHK